MNRCPRVISPAAMPPTEKGTTSGSSVSAPKVQTMDCRGRTQRRASGLSDPTPQRIAFGHGKVWTIPGSNAARTAGVAPPGRSTRAT